MVTRYRVDAEERDAFLSAAREALTVLAEQHGFICGSIGQATDEADLCLIRSEWESVGAYRRGLSSFDVKVRAIPLLSSAIDESSAFEIVHHWTPGARASASSGLAADAGAVRLGHASSPDVPPVST